MPNAPDKVIINHGGFNGRVAAINHEFNSLMVLGDEIIEKGWTKETNAMRDELRVECKKIDAALDCYLDYLRKLVDKFSDFIDNHP